MAMAVAWRGDGGRRPPRRRRGGSRSADKPRMQNQNFEFLKIALNRVLTLADYRSRRELSGSSGIIDFENNRVCKQFEH